MGRWFESIRAHQINLNGCCACGVSFLAVQDFVPTHALHRIEHRIFRGMKYRLEIVIELRNPAEADQHSWVIPITIPA